MAPTVGNGAPPVAVIVGFVGTKGVADPEELEAEAEGVIKEEAGETDSGETEEEAGAELEEEAGAELEEEAGAELEEEAGAELEEEAGTGTEGFGSTGTVGIVGPTGAQEVSVHILPAGQQVPSPQSVSAPEHIPLVHTVTPLVVTVHSLKVGPASR